MIREHATVTAVEGSHVWVQTQRETACQSCSAQKGCGTSTIGKVIGKQYTQVKAINQCHAKMGDIVAVGLSENMLLKSSFAVYLIPLVLMFFGAIVFDYLAKSYGFSPDWFSPLGALGGAVLGFSWLKFYSKKVALNKDFQPICLEVLERGELKINATYTP